MNKRNTSLKMLLYVLILIGFSCKKEKNDTNILPLKIESPSNVKIMEDFYSIVLSWNLPSDNAIKKIRIYRDTISSKITLYKEIDIRSQFKDELVTLNQKYYYKISFVNNSNIESEKSEELSGVPKEPINTNTPKNGEIGGINYAYWNFKNPTFSKLIHQFTIYDEPRNLDGSLNKDGLYYQFYQGIINDTIGFYYGIQTAVMKPNGENKKGIIFSRWNTRDTSNYKLAEGGWGQSAGYEGDFIGVRINYDWTIGTYNIELRKDSTDKKGDWYSLWITHLKNAELKYVGSIRFENSSVSTGIKNGGITWSELYFKHDKNTPLPRWHVAVNETKADGERPKSVTTAYSKTTFVGFSNIFTTNNQDVHFYMGPKVANHKLEGLLWISN